MPMMIPPGQGITVTTPAGQETVQGMQAAQAMLPRQQQAPSPFREVHGPDLVIMPHEHEPKPQAPQQPQAPQAVQQPAQMAMATAIQLGLLGGAGGWGRWARGILGKSRGVPGTALAPMPRIHVYSNNTKYGYKTFLPPQPPKPPGPTWTRIQSSTTAGPTKPTTPAKSKGINTALNTLGILSNIGNGGSSASMPGPASFKDDNDYSTPLQSVDSPAQPNQSEAKPIATASAFPGKK